VFGAGTVQWPWGLDGTHERGSSTPDASMQQATVNLFADMGVQPRSLQGGLTGASPSTDRVAPTPTITTPATIDVAAGTPQTVAGIATDAGGGVVGAVEVSVDAGASWHPATGRDSWSFTWTPATSGRVTPLARAADDSGNLTGADQSTPPPGGGPASRGAQGRRSGRRARAVAIVTRRVRMSRKGAVRLRVACRTLKRDCRVRLRLRLHGRTIAHRRFTVEGGDTRRVTLVLSRAARRKLARKRSLRVTALTTAGHRTARTHIRILAPKRG
jgi:hypothetical protein